jgi:WD40 repeat protein
VLVLQDHDRTVYSITWGPGKPGAMQGGCESLGWIASTGSDGRINVWAFGVSRYGAAPCICGGVFDLFHFQELPDSAKRNPPKYKLIARLEGAHGVDDVNSIAWCPRKGCEDLIATVGDDGVAKIWKVVSV